MRIFRKLFFYGLLFFCCATGAFSSITEGSSFIKDFNSRNWTVSDGLPGNTVTDIIQSSDGYIYIGSYEGLVRFDGVQFTILKKNIDERLNFASARAIFEDSRKNLWIGANDEGITCIKKDGSIEVYSTKNGLPNNSIRAICEDNFGRIWVGTASGLACISEGRVEEPAGIDILPKENKYLIKRLFCDSNDRVWIVTEDTGEAFYYKDEAFYSVGGFSALKDSLITTVYQDAEGDLWFGAAPHYVIKINTESMKEEIVDLGYGRQKGSAVVNIFQDSEKKIWFCLDTGIAVKKGDEIFYLTPETGLADEKIGKVIEDFEGNIWIATDRGGVQKLSRSKFKMTKLSSTVNAIVEDDFRNCVWLGADDGLYCIQNEQMVTNSITEKFKNMRIRHVGVTSDGKLLISSYTKVGQAVVFPDGTIKSWTKDTGLVGNKVRVALQSKENDIYVGTTTGLSIITRKNELVDIKKEIGIKNDFIMCLFEDSEGNIWCGTDGGGIFILKHQALFKTITTDDGLAGNVIFKICEVRKGEIWITTGTGLTILLDGKMHNFNDSNGLGIDSVFQAIDDQNGKIWFTSNRGIFSMRSEFFDEKLAGRDSLIQPKFYGISDGIVSNGVTSTSLSIREKNGDLLFTMIDGVIRYDSKRASEKSFAPVIHVEEILIDSRKCRYDGAPVVLDSSVNRISIEYTGLHFGAPEQLRFRTKLEGFDSDYSEWTSDRIVSYTNLSPKTYKFSVSAMSGDEVVSNAEGILTVVKKPAVWQRIWFWALSIILLVLLLVKIIQTRIKILKNAQKKLEEIVQERTAELTELQHSLVKQVEDRTAELRNEKENVQRLSVEVTMALAGTIDAKDKYTKGHSQRVAEYSRMLAKALGKDEEYQSRIYYIAILHDIGKIGIPDSIINNPGKLSDEEYAVIKKHPEIGSEILKSITSMPEVSIGARWHHERYDGKGYPDGLAADKIPELARIICVADSYDAMTSNRSYRTYLPQAVVREELVKNKGTQFDSFIAEKMIELIDEDKDYKMHE